MKFVNCLLVFFLVSIQLSIAQSGTYTKYLNDFESDINKHSECQAFSKYYDISFNYKGTTLIYEAFERDLYGDKCKKLYRVNILDININSISIVEHYSIEATTFGKDVEVESSCKDTEYEDFISFCIGEMDMVAAKKLKSNLINAALMAQECLK